MGLPVLPRRAAYLTLSNPTRRNALGLSVLRSLKSQLVDFNTDLDGRITLLPPYKPKILKRLQSNRSPGCNYLIDAEEWEKRRGHLPKVLVLRSEGPVFSSGHDLKELMAMDRNGVKETFDTCVEVMDLITRSPAPVVCAVQGLATAAGFQLAMSTDFPIALADTPFQLPGVSIGLPCTSPSTAVSRRVPPALTYRLLATGESIRADQLQGAVDVVPVPEHAESSDTASAAFEKRISKVVTKLASTAGQPQALGKWAYWTQLHVPEYKEAADWAGRVMAIHARSEDAVEGVDAFLRKRKPVWKT